MEIGSYKVRTRLVVVPVVGDKLAVGLALEAEGGPPPGILERALEAFLEGRLDPPGDPVGAAAYYATLYGGVVLVYTGGPIVAISRVLPEARLELLECRGVEARARDEDILEAWARIAWGDPQGFTRLSPGCTHWPRGYKLAPGRGSLVAPIGLSVERKT